MSLAILDRKEGKKISVYDVRSHVPHAPALSTRSAPPRFDKEVFVVANFDVGNVNRLGGHFGSFAKAPGRAHARLDKGLRLSYTQTAGTFAGAWIHLFDDRSHPSKRVFLDATKVKWITFLVRGTRGGEKLIVKLADRDWEQKGDSLPIGPLDEFLPKGRVTRRWQRAWIPLSRLPTRLKRSQLATLVFASTVASSGDVSLRDLLLTTSRDAKLPKAPPRHIVERKVRKALWLWETLEVIKSSDNIRSFVEFCRRRGITDVFAQLPYAPNDAPRRVEDVARLRPLVVAAHAAGVRVDGLDGAPYYVRPKRHAEVIATVRAVLDYNAKQPKEAQYDGLRFDNEPYLLPEYAGPRRQSVLRNYLDITTRAATMAGEAGLRFGVDIPFWFDARDRFAQPTARIDGRPLSELLIDAVDNIAIMAYRTRAYGPDGVISHSSDEVRYATKVGKDVFVGLETVELPDEVIYAFTAEAPEASDQIVVEDKGNGTARIHFFAKGTPVTVTGRVLRASHRAIAPATKQTFAKIGAEELHQVGSLAVRELAPLSGFYGLAIHSYKSYRQLLQPTKE